LAAVELSAEEAWPYDGRASAWPPTEPPGLDAVAKEHRLAFYKGVRSVLECKQVVAIGQPVLVGVEINDKWACPPGGRIPEPSSEDLPFANHAVLIDAYDESTGLFRFRIPGATLGVIMVSGTLSGHTLEATWWEGWRFFPGRFAPSNEQQSIGQSRSRSAWLGTFGTRRVGPAF